MKTVHFVNAARRAAGPDPVAFIGDIANGWQPSVWLGAPSVGGLALPAAQPTAAWLYAPRGVYLDDDLLVVADTGNHRVLIWHGLPSTDHQPCDVVLGQPDAHSEGAAAGGSSVRLGMHLPTGVLVHDGKLLVADAWHHRVLVYDQVPTAGPVEPDHVIGQRDLDGVLPNHGAGPTIDSLYWPFGIAVVAGRFYIADTGNRRVLGWSGGVVAAIAGQPPDLLLGQPDAISRDENRGAPAGPDSFRWPHGISGSAGQLLVADAGNHRLLGWHSDPADGMADLVIGQADFTASTEWPYAPQRADLLRFPYALDIDGARLAVADTANNRILLWDRYPSGAGVGAPAGAVLGQPSFASNGDNRWDSVGRDTLCWPYGLSLHGDLLAIADSGNNRVMIWKREPPAGTGGFDGAALDRPD